MNVAIRLLRLTPTEAILAFESDDPTTTIRGVLTGPTCEYSSTIDISYSIQANRVLIPEPAWWDPESPFLYHGRLECFRNGVKLGDRRFPIGLRHTVYDGTGVVHNGKRIELRTERLTTVDENEIRRLRSNGVNCIEAPAGDIEAACQIADRVGMFVLVSQDAGIDRLIHPSALIR